MRGKKKRVIAAAAVIAALAAGGVAFTDTITTTSTAVQNGAVAGYGTVSVNASNALQSLSYVFNPAGDQIVGVNLKFATPLATTQHVDVGFDGAALKDCGAPADQQTVTDCYLAVPVTTKTSSVFDVLVEDGPLETH